jgi:hypothetical protein
MTTRRNEVLKFTTPDRKIHLRKLSLEERFSGMIGAPVELTIRGEREFTFSTETVCADLPGRVAAFFGPLATVTGAHDPECGSFAYVTAAH